MHHLSDEQVASLRTRLLEERARLGGEVGLPMADEAEIEPSDAQDRARAERDRGRAFAVRDLARNRLVEIDAALTRIDRGTYGICEETGDEIPYARLRAEPTARHTIEAQELLEREHAQFDRRPASEEPY